MKLPSSAGARHTTLLLAVSITFILTLVACGTTAPTPPPAAKRPIHVQLAWVNTIEYSGFFSAQDQGYYDAANLDVSLDELGQTSPIDQVVTGKAQFGITSADNVLLARSAGKPVVAIATIYQRSPVAFVSLANSHITKPQDFINKTVVVDLKGTTGIIYRALLASQSIGEAQVKTQPRADYTNDALLNGQADVIDAFINNQPVQLKQQGHDINVILPSDYGIDLYANVIFTTEEMITTQPEVVEAFVRATTLGMQRAIQDPEAATRLTVARGTNLDPKAEATSMRLALPLMNPAGSRPGMMTAENWQTANQILHDQGLLTQQLDVQQAYTLTFLNKVYGK
jgi:ABC-type nitrate/sulfonate/bicarbonate transport system substrate-binding protein